MNYLVKACEIHILVICAKLYLAQLFPPIEIKARNWKWKTFAEGDMCQHLKQIHTACGPTEFGLRRK